MEVGWGDARHPHGSIDSALASLHGSAKRRYPGRSVACFLVIFGLNGRYWKVRSGYHCLSRDR